MHVVCTPVPILTTSGALRNQFTSTGSQATDANGTLVTCLSDISSMVVPLLGMYTCTDVCIAVVVPAEGLTIAIIPCSRLLVSSTMTRAAWTMLPHGGKWSLGG